MKLQDRSIKIAWEQAQNHLKDIVQADQIYSLPVDKQNNLPDERNSVGLNSLFSLDSYNRVWEAFDKYLRRSLELKALLK
jgi:hypothetical protein